MTRPPPDTAQAGPAPKVRLALITVAAVLPALVLLVANLCTGQLL